MFVIGLTIVFVVNRVCRLTVKRKGMEVSISSGHKPALSLSMSCLSSKSFGARPPGPAKSRVN